MKIWKIFLSYGIMIQQSEQLAFTSEDFFYWRSLKVKFLFHAIANQGCLSGIRPLETSTTPKIVNVCMCMHAKITQNP